jgi:hypothetical protein
MTSASCVTAAFLWIVVAAQDAAEQVHGADVEAGRVDEGRTCGYRFILSGKFHFMVNFSSRSSKNFAITFDGVKQIAPKVQSGALS